MQGLRGLMVLGAMIIYGAFVVGCRIDDRPLDVIADTVLHNDVLGKFQGKFARVDVVVSGFEDPEQKIMDDWLKRVSRSELASANVFGRVGNGTEETSPDFRVVVKYDIQSRGNESGLVVCALTVIDEKTKETLIQKRSRSYEAAPKGLKDACRSAIAEVIRSCQSKK